MSYLYWDQGLYLTGECKCDACFFHNLCRDEGLACKEYEFWVNEAKTGHDMKLPINPKPSKKYYNKVFGDENESI